MFAVTQACSLLGTAAVPVRVEAHVQSGLPSLAIVGLRDGDAREVRERIRCGLACAGIPLPLRRVTVSLAPADLPKAGAAFDLPIVLALLAAMGELPPGFVETIGAQAEIGLDGSLRPVLGTMASALTAAREGWSAFIVAGPAAQRAAHASVPVLRADTLVAVIAHARGEQPLLRSSPLVESDQTEQRGDLSDVRGQAQAVSALEVAAAGGHNLLLYGPPGCGKTMLASRVPTLLPPLSGDEALEVATIHDAAGVGTGWSDRRPFRSPHHTISQQALVGGGSTRAIVGELTLAHRGVLFLDELPEFRPSAIDALRQPLEHGHVTIRRARWMVRYPSSVQLVGAMNLCRCGRAGNARGQSCSCSPTAAAAYRQRVSGAILDRFDLAVRLDLPGAAVTSLPPAVSSATVRARVSAAWQRQDRRWGTGMRNAHATSERTPRLGFTPAARAQADRAARSFAFSARVQTAMARIARTIADLDESEPVEPEHVALAQGLCNRGFDNGE